MSDKRTLEEDDTEGQGLIGSATPAMVEALRFIGAYIVAHGCAPTVRELAAELQRTKAVAHKVIRQLQSRGYIAVAFHRRRGIDITAKGLALIGGNHGTEERTP